MRRILLAAAVLGFMSVVVSPSSAALAPPGPTQIIPGYCIVLDENLQPRPPIVPANTPLTLWFAWASANRGLDMNWINGTELALTINGVSYSNLDSYYQPPGDLHWPTGNELIDSLWAIPWSFPVPFTLAPGNSFTYTFTITNKHRLTDGASPNPDGPGNSPYFYEAGDSSTTTCTVTAQS
jgi:hypothetical protein